MQDNMQLNLYDNLTTTEVTTATRISVDLVSQVINYVALTERIQLLEVIGLVNLLDAIALLGT